MSTSPIRPSIRLACGILGGALTLFAVLGVVNDSENRSVYLYAALPMGVLFLIPALLAGPRPWYRSSDQQRRLVVRTRVALGVFSSVGFVALACGALYKKFHPTPSPKWQTFMTVASVVWLIGFILRFFLVYYIDQGSRSEIEN